MPALNRRIFLVCLLTVICVYWACSYQVTWSSYGSSLQCYDGCPVSGREDATPQTAGTGSLLVTDSYGSTSIAAAGAHLLRGGHVTSVGSYAATLPCSKADHLGLGALVEDEYHSPLCIAHHHHHNRHQQPPSSPPTSGVSQSRDVVVPDVTSSPRRCQLYLYDCPPTSAAAAV